MTQIETTQPGLFTQLDALLTARAVLITVSKIDGDSLQVNICPRQLKDGENPALTVPLCMTGTAAELDTDLVPQIARFVSSHIGLNSNLNAMNVRKTSAVGCVQGGQDLRPDVAVGVLC